MRDHKRNERRVAERERILRQLHEAETAAKGVQVREHLAPNRPHSGSEQCRAAIADGGHGCTACCWHAGHECDGAMAFDAWVDEGA